jgi:hypothetical protein
MIVMMFGMASLSEYSHRRNALPQDIARGLARETAEIFKREAEHVTQMAEAAVANRVLGTTCFAECDFAEALAKLEEALRKYHLGHDLAAQALDC